MNELVLRAVLGLLAVGAPAGLVGGWLGAADKRLSESDMDAQEVAIASVSEDAYCTPRLKSIVRRVATACGLVDSGGRGCQPMQAKSVAQLSDEDFNALFRPLQERAAIVQFDADVTELDDGARALVERVWADQRGASFFFVVSRASPDGKADHNERLSAARAESVLTHLEQRFRDPDLSRQVGLLWLGAGFAQLDEDFCKWNRSRSAECTTKDINRSAFIAWIDCAI